MVLAASPVAGLTKPAMAGPRTRKDVDVPTGRERDITAGTLGEGASPAKQGRAAVRSRDRIAKKLDRLAEALCGRLCPAVAFDHCPSSSRSFDAPPRFFGDALR